MSDHWLEGVLSWGDHESVEQYIITKVTPYKSEDRPEYDGFEVCFDGRCWALRNTELPEGVEPKEGDRLTLYTHQYSAIHGVILNDTLVFYRLPQEVLRGWKQEQEERDKKQLADFEANKDAMDARFDALPEVFQTRIQMRRDRNADFRVKFEDYEMTACEGAIALAEWSKGEWQDNLVQNAIDDFWGDEAAQRKAWPNADPGMIGKPEDERLARVYWWSQLDWKHQCELVPAFEKLDSGNIFGMGMALGRCYIERPDLVPMMMGALAPLVGSEEYGDPIDLMEEASKREEANA